MTIIAGASTTGRATTRCATTGVCLVSAVALLSGCGGGPPAAPQEVVTVTITPTVTARTTQPSPMTATTAAAGNVKSDVVGRKYDLGTIVRVQDEAGVPVIIFDRWSMRGTPDSAVALQGVPIRVHSDAPYVNQNSQTTYRIPVAPRAVFVYTHCVAIDQPAVQESSTLNAFARLPDAEKVVLLTLDPKGQVYRAQNDPAC